MSAVRSLTRSLAPPDHITQGSAFLVNSVRHIEFNSVNSSYLTAQIAFREREFYNPVVLSMKFVVAGVFK